jgi:hypothetical protein
VLDVRVVARHLEACSDDFADLGHEAAVLAQEIAQGVDDVGLGSGLVESIEVGAREYPPRHGLEETALGPEVPVDGDASNPRSLRDCFEADGMEARLGDEVVRSFEDSLAVFFRCLGSTIEAIGA